MANYSSTGFIPNNKNNHTCNNHLSTASILTNKIHSLSEAKTSCRSLSLLKKRSKSSSLIDTPIWWREMMTMKMNSVHFFQCLAMTNTKTNQISKKFQKFFIKISRAFSSSKIYKWWSWIITIRVKELLHLELDWVINQIQDLRVKIIEEAKIMMAFSDMKTSQNE